VSYERVNIPNETNLGHVKIQPGSILGSITKPGRNLSECLLFLRGYTFGTPRLYKFSPCVSLIRHSKSCAGWHKHKEGIF